MSLAGFEALQRAHPERRGELRKLEHELRAILVSDAKGLLDEQELAQRTHVNVALIEACLVQLESLSAVTRVFIWICPLTAGTVAEASALDQLPVHRQCHVCGQQHWRHGDDIEVKFVAARSLLQSLSR